MTVSAFWTRRRHPDEDLAPPGARFRHTIAVARCDWADREELLMGPRPPGASRVMPPEVKTRWLAVEAAQRPDGEVWEVCVDQLPHWADDLELYSHQACLDAGFDPS